MSKYATKANENVFYLARSEAAKFNDSLASREGASEMLGTDRTRLARIELGSQDPLPEDVLLMADLYKRPELCNHYCTKICPIGRKTMLPMIDGTMSEMAIKLYCGAHDMDEPAEKFLRMMADGKLDAMETEELKQIVPEIEGFTNILQSWLLIAKKQLEGGERIEKKWIHESY